MHTSYTTRFCLFFSSFARTMYVCILQFNIEPKPIPSTYELHLSHVIYARLSRPALTTLKMHIGAVGMSKDAFRVRKPTNNGFYVFFFFFIYLKRRNKKRFEQHKSRSNTHTPYEYYGRPNLHARVKGFEPLPKFLQKPRCKYRLDCSTI